MKTNLFVPHIDKTGGVALTEVLIRDLTKAGWTYDLDAGLSINDNIKNEKHARIGMHNPFLPEYMENDKWFKFLVIREPYDRFVSGFNYFKYEIWRDSGSFFNLSIEEYVDIVQQKNLGLNRLAERHIGANLPYENYSNYIKTVLSKFPWAPLLEPRGYISSSISLNAEKIDTYPEYTANNIMERFDVIIDRNRFDEIPEIFLKNIGIEVNMNSNSNSIQQVYSMIPGAPNPFKLEDLTASQKEKIFLINEFKYELAFWEVYQNSHHAKK